MLWSSISPGHELHFGPADLVHLSICSFEFHFARLFYLKVRQKKQWHTPCQIANQADDVLGAWKEIAERAFKGCWTLKTSEEFGMNRITWTNFGVTGCRGWVRHLQKQKLWAQVTSEKRRVLTSRPDKMHFQMLAFSQPQRSISPCSLLFTVMPVHSCDSAWKWSRLKFLSLPLMSWPKQDP